MNEHDLYMNDFMKVYETLEYWGPGSGTDTQKALSCIPKAPTKILEIGCGKGLATKVLAEHSEATITAVDNEQLALDRLTHRFEQHGMSERLKTVNASMTALPFSNESFDLIWAEGSAYIMGVEKALAQWRPLLQKNGFLVLSDMVWWTNVRSKEAVELWNNEYPDMQLMQDRAEQMIQAGYLLLDHFPMSEEAWLNYYGPLKEKITELEPEMPSSVALKDIKHEVDVSTRFAHEFGYHMFILEKA